MPYYNPENLKNMKCLDGSVPLFYITCGTRGFGKSTAIPYMFLKEKKVMGMVYRSQDELDGSVDKVYNNVHKLYYPDSEFKQIGKKANGYVTYLKDDEVVGYGLSLRSARKLKLVSGVLSNIDVLFFDEYQPEDNCYLTNEMDKLLSLYTTIARGVNETFREVPFWFAMNMYTVLCPLFTSLRITERIRRNTKRIRGDGWAFELSVNPEYKKEIMSTQFGRMFGQTNYFNATSGDYFLFDFNDSYIISKERSLRYITTLTKMGKPVGSVRSGEKALYLVTSIWDDSARSETPIEAETDIRALARSYVAYGLTKAADIKAKALLSEWISY